MQVNSLLRPFALIDRDGTLIVQQHYLADPERVALLPNTAAGLRALRALGYGLVVVSNQSAVGRGLLTLAQLHDVNQRVVALLAEQGIQLDGIYVCPHHPDAGCECRKPKPGMALRAAAELGIDLGRSCVIGDAAVDIGLAREVGADALLVRTGHGLREDEQAAFAPDALVDDVLGASRWLAQRRSPATGARAEASA